MYGALWVLTKLRFRAAVRKVWRALRRPRGAILALFFLGCVGSVLLPNLLVSHKELPKIDFLWFLDAKVLFAIWVVLTVSGQNATAIAFSMSEIEFLFPGPFSRRQLLVYKLLISWLGPIGTGLMLPFLLWRFDVWIPALLLGFCLAYIFIQTLALLGALVVNWLNERFVRWRWLLAIAVALPLAWSTWHSGALADGLAPLERVEALESTWTAQVALAPFSVFTHLVRAMDVGQLVLWGAAALAANAIVFVLVLWMDANFLEASLTASQRRYEFLERAKRGGGLPSLRLKSRPRLGLPRFPRLAGAGPIAWRQALEVLRTSSRLLFVLPTILAIAAPALIAGRKDTLSIAIFAVTFFTGFMVSIAMPMGLRTDLQHIEVLKTLPLRAGAIVWGSIFSAVLYPALLQVFAVVLLSAGAGRWPWASTAAVCFVLPLNLLLAGADSVLVMLYPSTQQFASGDPMLGLRISLGYAVKLLIILVATTVAGFYVLAVRWVVGDSPLAFVLMVAGGWIALVVQGAGVVWLASRLFERFDPALDSDGR